MFRKILRHAESTRQHTIMSRLLIELDRCVRRRRVVRRYWTGKNHETQDVLRACPNRCLPPAPPQTRLIRHPVTGQQIRWSKTSRRPGPDDRLFTQTTRAWLRRRVWRYFRKLSFSNPDVYLSVIANMLTDYRDDDFTISDQIVDNRAFMHIAFFHSAALVFGANHVNIEVEATPANLTPAPWRPEIWASPAGYEALLAIAADASSRFVRLWAIDLLEAEHPDELTSLAPQRLIGFLRHSDPSLRELATDIVESHKELGLCSSAELVDLTIHENPTVSAIGFDRLCRRYQQKPCDVDSLCRISDNACPDTSDETTRWSLAALVSPPHRPTADQLARFFDAQSPAVCTAALKWLKSAAERSPRPAGLQAPDFWLRLANSTRPGICSASVTILRTRSRSHFTTGFGEYFELIVDNPTAGVRNRVWALEQIACLSIERSLAALNNDENDKRLLRVLCSALRSSSVQLSQMALSLTARCAAKSSGFHVIANQHIAELEITADPHDPIGDEPSRGTASPP